MPTDKNDQRPIPRSPASWVTLATIGVLAVVMGVVFVLFRPFVLLLPEDQRFTGITSDQLKAFNSQLFVWIGMVFRSWGAFAIGLGSMMAAVSATAYRRGDRWAWWALAGTGVPTFGIFLAVNLVLDSDFKFVIGFICFAYFWALWHGRR